MYADVLHLLLHKRDLRAGSSRFLLRAFQHLLGYVRAGHVISRLMQPKRDFARAAGAIKYRFTRANTAGSQQIREIIRPQSIIDVRHQPVVVGGELLILLCQVFRRLPSIVLCLSFAR